MKLSNLRIKTFKQTNTIKITLINIYIYIYIVLLKY